MKTGLISLLVLGSAVAFNEEPCRSLEGFCMDYQKCPGDDYQSGKCPTQGRSIRCCLSVPYQESACESAGGTCLDDQKCIDGQTVSGKCPTQPAGVKCCIGQQSESGSSPSLDCSKIGGVCQNYNQCESLIVSGICPGSSAQRCCVSGKSVDTIQLHLNHEEGGLYLQGYIPTSGSGVTIATGVDLGQQSQSGIKSLGVGSALLDKLSPYVGKKTRAAVQAAGLDPKNLILTLDEAIALDRGFLDANLRRIAPYDDELSMKGKAVLASLTHWCYNVVDNTSDGKCYHKDCTNFLRNVLIGRKATDSDLKNALIGQKGCLTRLNQASWKIARIQSEINFL